ncbi:MAG: biotin transporter BioY [Syntrophomonadaceae bacterium]
MPMTESNRLRQMVYASMFGALTAIGSLIVIPLQPVPITLQTLFTSLAGVLLGGYTAAWSQIIYVLLGLIGLPVFAGGKAGLGTLLGPTGGYLLGFIAGAYVIGKITEQKEKPGLAWIGLALAAGNLVIYALGVAQLSLVARLSWLEASLLGVVPFLAGDLVKLAAAAWLGFKFRGYVKY